MDETILEYINMPNPIYIRDEFYNHTYLIQDAFGTPFLVDANGHDDALEIYAEACIERGFNGLVQSFEDCCDYDPDFAESFEAGECELYYTEAGFIDTTDLHMVEDPTRAVLIERFADKPGY